MKSCFVILALFGTAVFATAAQMISVDDVGVSIEIPDSWKQSDKDTFGVVVSPASAGNKKIRIHLTAHKGIPAKEAVQRSAKKLMK